MTEDSVEWRREKGALSCGGIFLKEGYGVVTFVAEKNDLCVYMY